jgi:hypothetical protein
MSLYRVSFLKKIFCLALDFIMEKLYSGPLKKWGPMRKIIFLDIDGVLVTRNSDNNEILLKRLEHEQHNYFDPDAVKNLNRLLLETGASIVVSSSWRSGKSIRELIDILRFGGVENPPVVGVTPFLHNDRGKRSKRGKEILQWLSEHPEVNSYCVIDDCGVKELDGVPRCRYIETNMLFGFGDKVLSDIALRILNHHELT